MPNCPASRLAAAPTASVWRTQLLRLVEVLLQLRPFRSPRFFALDPRRWKLPAFAPNRSRAVASSSPTAFPPLLGSENLCPSPAPCSKSVQIRLEPKDSA